MKRMTIRNGAGVAFWVDTRCPNGGYRVEDKRDQKRLDRLAAYEDTGLKPDEIIDLKRAWDMYGGELGITNIFAENRDLKEKVLELMGLDGAVEPEDVRIITQEEHEKEYGDG